MSNPLFLADPLEIRRFQSDTAGASGAVMSTLAGPQASLEAGSETGAEASLGTFVLTGDEGRHAVTVRRLRAGEQVDLGDGLGTVLSGRVASAEGKDRLVVTVDSVTLDPVPTPKVTVIQALAKGDRGELAVETMTEVGVDEIVPWAATRSISVWRGERVERGLSKWRATAREASKQSRRPRLANVADLAGTAEVAARLRAADLAVVLHESGPLRLAALGLPTSGEIVLVVGPEGGVAPEELEVFAAAGAHIAKMGPSVLRSSTAGTAAAAVILARSGRWG